MAIPDILRIAIVPLLGIFDANVTEEGRVSVVGGYESQLLQLIVQGLGVQHQVLVPPDRHWGYRLEDGNWTGMFGMLARNEADLGIASLYLTNDRREVVDFSYPYDSTVFTFATRYPEEIHPASAFVQVFTHPIWMGLSLTVLLMPMLLKCLLTKRHSLYTLFFDVSSSLLRQPTSIKAVSFVDHLLVTSWLFFALVVSLSYSSVLFSFLTVPLREQEIKDIKSLSKAVQDGKMKCFVIRESYVPVVMSNHSDRNIRTLVGNINKKGWLVESAPELVRKTVFKDGNAFIDTDKFLKLSLGDRLFVSQDPLSTHPVAVAFGKKFKMREKLDEVIHRITASGMYSKSLDVSLSRRIPGGGGVSESDPVRTITLQKLQGAFIVLFLGHTSTLFVFLLELLLFKVSNCVKSSGHLKRMFKRD